MKMALLRWLLRDCLVVRAVDRQGGTELFLCRSMEHAKFVFGYLYRVKDSRDLSPEEIVPLVVMTNGS